MYISIVYSSPSTSCTVTVNVNVPTTYRNDRCVTAHGLSLMSYYNTNTTAITII